MKKETDLKTLATKAVCAFVAHTQLGESMTEAEYAAALSGAILLGEPIASLEVDDWDVAAMRLLKEVSQKSVTAN